MCRWASLLLAFWLCCVSVPSWAAEAETGTATAPRLVVLPLDALECVRLLGGMDRVCGVTHHAAARRALLPEVRNIPSVGRGFSPNLEALAALRPNIVVAWKGYPGPELERQLEPLGIRILRLDLHVPDNLEDGVRTLAAVLGGDALDRGEAFLRWNQEQESRLRASIPPDASPVTVLGEHFAPERLAGPGSALFALTEKAGGRNLAAGLRLASSPVNAEWIAAQKPAVCVKSVSLASLDPEIGQRQLEAARQEFAQRPGWRDMDAVKRGRVYALSSDILGGPRWVVGMAALVGMFYPEAAPQADARALHEEYLRRFQEESKGGALYAP